MWTAEPSQIAQENHKLLSVFACIVYTEMRPGSAEMRFGLCLKGVDAFPTFNVLTHFFSNALAFVFVVLFGGGRSRKNLETALNFS